MLGFILYSLVGAAFILLGIRAFFAKREVAFGFWANTDMFPVTDVKAYNKAVGKLWCVYGCIFILLGAPLLAGQNNPLILISIIGVMAESITAMAVYVVIIETKYRKHLFSTMVSSMERKSGCSFNRSGTVLNALDTVTFLQDS